MKLFVFKIAELAIVLRGAILFLLQCSGLLLCRQGYNSEETQQTAQDNENTKYDVQYPCAVSAEQLYQRYSLSVVEEPVKIAYAAEDTECTCKHKQHTHDDPENDLACFQKCHSLFHI